MLHLPAEKKGGNIMVVEKKFPYGNARQNEWARIDLPDIGDYGSWEHMSDEDDDETYFEGGLWFEGKTLVDYDGCYELPQVVITILEDEGFDCSEI